MSTSSILDNYSLDLTKNFFTFLIDCIVLGNLSIVLSKLSSSGIISDFTNLADDVLRDVFKAEPGYNPCDRKQRDEKLIEAFTIYLHPDGAGNFNGLNMNNEKIYKLVEGGSSKRVMFDMIINKSKDKEFNLVYFKMKEKFLKSFLISLFNTFEGHNALWVFFALTFVRFKLLCIKSAELIMYVFYLLSLIGGENLILFIFAFPLSYILNLFGSIAAICVIFFILSYIYFYFQNFLLMYQPMYRWYMLWTEGDKDAKEALLKEFDDSWFKILIQIYASFICFVKNIFIYIICLFYILIMTIVYIGLAVAYCFLSQFGILLYGFIRVCLMEFYGLFVESCDPPCDDPETENFQFSGNHKFNVYKSFFYTFVRHILWYYFLIVLFVILPVVNSELGNSYIFLGVLFAVIIGNMIYKFLHPKKIAKGTEMEDREMREPSAPPLDDDGTHMAGEMKDAIFSFLKGKKDHSEVDPYRDASAPPLDDDSGTHVAGDMKDAIFSFLKDKKKV